MAEDDVARDPESLRLRLLREAWRHDLQPLQIRTGDLRAITEWALSSGVSALVWRRLASPALQQIGSASRLAEAYRQHNLEAAVHEIQVCDIFNRIRSMGVEPILFKGWALARLYPESGLRPYGDIDLWLPVDRLEDIYRVFRSEGYPLYCVELHTLFYPQYERSLAMVMERSQLIALDGIQVRVPCPEDHLRFVCLHFLHHGGWRPLWLCDVALMVESRVNNFDWDRCLAGNRKYADWIACVIGLAHNLLGADITGTPFEKRAKNLPGWLAPAVLKQWQKGAGMSFAENLSFSLPRRLLNPAALVRSFREHWRNPIQASVEMNAWFGESPRGLLQVGSIFLRFPDFVRYFGREIRRT